MSGLAWFAAGLPVRLLVAGMRHGPALPAAAGERPPRLPPPRAVELGMRALERAAAAGERKLDDPAQRWRELGNKIGAFASFRSAAEPAAAPDAEEAAGAVEVPFDELWRREGRGFLRGRQAAAGRVAPAPGPDPRERLPSNTGLGLGLASYHLEGLRRPVARERLGRALERFVEDARRLASPGYTGAVVEALGLTVRLSHPRLLLRVDAELAARPAPLRAFFWHGVGRGLYFDPREMVPRAGDGWPAVERALSLPPAAEARRNAVAGLAWAAALVNFTAPEIVDRRLRDLWLEAGGEEARDAAANGVASVTLLWLNAVGDGPLLRDFRSQWEAGPDPWRRRIRAAVETAIDRVYPVLVGRNRIEEIFRHRPVSGWAAAFGDGVAAFGREVPSRG